MMARQSKPRFGTRLARSDTTPSPVRTTAAQWEPSWSMTSRGNRASTPSSDGTGSCSTEPMRELPCCWWGTRAIWRTSVPSAERPPAPCPRAPTLRAASRPRRSTAAMWRRRSCGCSGTSMTSSRQRWPPGPRSRPPTGAPPPAEASSSMASRQLGNRSRRSVVDAARCLQEPPWRAAQAAQVQRCAVAERRVGGHQVASPEWRCGYAVTRRNSRSRAAPHRSAACGALSPGVAARRRQSRPVQDLAATVYNLPP
mmetsp:Transcript_124035/g.358705  ORF Transcript_124035/g.358705 Transcript_124035/m.358705 type:complete len:255 (+) Transcript_124035:312-1076(+)